jgi:hypothetical protein
MSRSQRRPIGRRKKVTPDEIRAYIEEAYQARQTEWCIELIDRCNDVDWAALLGLHLQLVELEHLRERMEDLPL